MLSGLAMGKEQALVAARYQKGKGFSSNSKECLSCRTDCATAEREGVLACKTNNKSAKEIQDCVFSQSIMHTMCIYRCDDMGC
jgi:hypothetical protein